MVRSRDKGEKRSAGSQAAVILRQAAPEDIPLITAIYADHVRKGLGSFEETAPSESDMGQRFEAILAAGYPYVVAVCVDSGTVLGYGYLSAYRPRPAYRFTVEDSVYVSAKSQGRGIGRKLLSHLIYAAQSLGYRQMIAMIGDRDNTASIRLHEALGFERAGQLTAVGFKFGRWVDVVILQRSIGSGQQEPP